MPRVYPIPSYSLHKRSGQARVRIDGRDYYLGPYGSPASRQEYARLIAERYRPGGAVQPAKDVGGTYPDLSINELFVRYLDFATG